MIITMKLQRIILLTIFLLAFAGVSDVLALGPPGPPTGPPPCWPPPCVIPLDGGISLLIAAGIAYGGKKVYDSRKKDPV